MCPVSARVFTGHRGVSSGCAAYSVTLCGGSGFGLGPSFRVGGCLVKGRRDECDDLLHDRLRRRTLSMLQHTRLVRR